MDFALFAGSQPTSSATRPSLRFLPWTCARAAEQSSCTSIRTSFGVSFGVVDATRNGANLMVDGSVEAAAISRIRTCSLSRRLFDRQRPAEATSLAEGQFSRRFGCMWKVQVYVRVRPFLPAGPRSPKKRGRHRASTRQQMQQQRQQPRYHEVSAIAGVPRLLTLHAARAIAVERESNAISVAAAGPPLDSKREQFDFEFTSCFDQDAGQEFVYDRAARDLVLSTLDGYNATIFAFGQTGSVRARPGFGHRRGHGS